MIGPLCHPIGNTILWAKSAQHWFHKAFCAKMVCVCLTRTITTVRRVFYPTTQSMPHFMIGCLLAPVKGCNVIATFWSAKTSCAMICRLLSPNKFFAMKVCFCHQATQSASYWGNLASVAQHNQCLPHDCPARFTGQAVFCHNKFAFVKQHSLCHVWSAIFIQHDLSAFVMQHNSWSDWSGFVIRHSRCKDGFKSMCDEMKWKASVGFDPNNHTVCNHLRCSRRLLLFSAIWRSGGKGSAGCRLKFMGTQIIWE